MQPKPTNKRKTRQPKRNAIAMPLGPHPTGPDSVRVQLRYFEPISFSGLSSPGVQHQFFRLNSCYDPNFTGTGHQPAAFDQWSAFYGKYRVLAARWKIWFANTDPIYPIGIAAVERANDQNTTSSLASVYEEPRSKFVAAAPRGSPTVKLQGSVSNAALLGISEREYLDQDYGALVTTNPAIQTFLYLYAEVPLSETSSTAQVMYCEIEYDTVFYEREELDPSVWAKFKEFWSSTQSVKAAPPQPPALQSQKGTNGISAPSSQHPSIRLGGLGRQVSERYQSPRD